MVRRSTSFLLALPLLLGLSACGPEPSVPPEEGPEPTFTEVVTVDAGSLSSEVQALETTTEVESLDDVQLLLSDPVARKRLVQAYKPLAEDSDSVWVKLVEVACLPPLRIEAVQRDETVDFLVQTDPDNALVDCVRVVPTLALVGVQK